MSQRNSRRPLSTATVCTPQILDSAGAVADFTAAMVQRWPDDAEDKLRLLGRGASRPGAEHVQTALQEAVQRAIPDVLRGSESRRSF